MPELKLHIKYSKNSPYIMSKRDLIDTYFYGVDVKAKDGSIPPNQIFMSSILAAQQAIEKYLGIKLIRQVVQEDHHYYGSDWSAWGMIRTSYPVNECVELGGWYGQQKHISVPKEWLVIKKSSDDMHHKAVWLVPNGVGNLQQTSAVFGGVVPYVRIGHDASVPDYWKLKYITGFDKIPMDLYNIVGMLASIPVLGILGDIVFGPGVSSTSISLDGLSQSISNVSSKDGSAYAARISLYGKQVTESLKMLRETYTGIRFTCV